MQKINTILMVAMWAAVFGLSVTGTLTVMDWVAFYKGGTTTVLKTEVITIPQQMQPMPCLPQIRWREYDV